MDLIIKAKLPDGQPIQKSSSITLAGIPINVYAVALASLLVVIGICWDISWHLSIGRDKLLSPPHLLIYAGAIFGGLFSAVQVLWNTFRADAKTKKRLIKVWGIFYSSLGAMFCIWGAVAMLTSAPFDDWWHNTYGLDVVVLSPPHALLGLGMTFLQIGACISIVKLINLKKGIHPPEGHEHRKFLILHLLFIVSAASLVCMVCTFLRTPLGPRNQRSFLFYGSAVLFILLLLPAFGRAMKIKWPITSVTIGYFLIVGCTNWILQLFPAEPLLGPILNPVTHFQPLQFPILFFVPGIAMDLVMQRGMQNEWKKALLLSIIFIFGLLAIQYPFSGFLVESPGARNWFFGSEAFYYGANPDWPFRYKFTNSERQPIPAFIKGLGIAILVGVFTGRISLRWGKWLTSIVR